MIGEKSTHEHPPYGDTSTLPGGRYPLRQPTVPLPVARQGMPACCRLGRSVLVFPKNLFAPHLFVGRYLPDCRGRSRPNPGFLVPVRGDPDNPGILGKNLYRTPGDGFRSWPGFDRGTECWALARSVRRRGHQLRYRRTRRAEKPAARDRLLGSSSFFRLPSGNDAVSVCRAHLGHR